MRTQMILAALAIVGGLILAARTATNPAPITLNDTGWLLATLNGQSVMSDNPITLSFESGKLSGSDGCNRYGTSYTVNGANFTVNKGIVATQMACPEPVMQQAASYITALTQVAVYRSDGQQLTLLDARGNALAMFTAQSKHLGGTSWNVTGYNNGKQAVVSVVLGAKLTAEFSADGRVGGSAGCNTYTAAYEASENSVKIGRAASTRKMCADPAGVMEQEAQYLKALESAAAYRVEGHRLELRTADGALAVTLEEVR